MKKSDTRILTTHAGSLPRNSVLTELLIRQEQGEKINLAELERATADAVQHVIQKQMEAGVDIGNDGEQPRIGFQTYVPQRMRGFGGESKRPTPQDMREFPDFMAIMQRRQMARAKVFNAPQAIAEVQYEDLSGVQNECTLSDCGFGTFAGWEMVAEGVVWAKLQACSDGAQLATQRLWGKGGLKTTSARKQKKVAAKRQGGKTAKTGRKVATKKTAAKTTRKPTKTIVMKKATAKEVTAKKVARRKR